MSFQELYALELLRITQPSRWERCFHHYELLLNAGLSTDEAAQKATETSDAEYAERQLAA